MWSRLNTGVILRRVSAASSAGFGGNADEDKRGWQIRPSQSRDRIVRLRASEYPATIKKPEEAWPQWAELYPDKAKYKQEIAAKYSEAALRQSWLAVCARLEELTAEMAVQQTAGIPELSYDETICPSEAVQERMRKAGCIVMCDTVPKETAEA
ncbi:hypothetical protein CMQ_6397 [Grosmannia clavigera kw1407]|uniref:Uncharacterized protein n=1 Tax=Grosmannia clavigera (strain kw1407 / UAMH 11150) TaxID=655863 RepID=F0XMP1_GROCL|nr:uncharacterized protein CMQ_6397 [Grosmannia clavigera kw1407]EFX01455.1 hypothetical protein CMQ_6397 [Grosmannia clavigera kw1407]